MTQYLLYHPIYIRVSLCLFHMQLNHFRLASDTCQPCDCYQFGAYGRSCDQTTGQCHCRTGVIGRRCDSCASKFAEVTLRGCEVVYDSCPRSFRGNIWWKRTPFGVLATQDCSSGMVGTASRYCNETEGWHEPNLGNCLSIMFVDLKTQVSCFFLFDANYCCLFSF